MYLEFVFNTEESTDVVQQKNSELVPFIIELKTWKRRSKEVVKMGVDREDDTIIDHYIPFLTLKPHRWYSP